jgi:membrane protein YdbS with pleckstrin-like domain
MAVRVTRVMTEKNDREPIVWESYPSWRQFSWLYLISAIVAWRALLFREINETVAQSWMIGAIVLVACAAILRRWGHYEVTAEQVRIRNGYTGRTISAIPVWQIQEVEVWRGPVARLFGIGTVLIREGDGQTLRFRGVAEPEVVKARIEALRSRGTRLESLAQPG